ncbi:MAG: deoxyribonuclease IV [Clostridia bacterium]
MLNIGCHLSVSKGFQAMGKEALSIGANCFQFFTRNPRGGKAKELDPKDVEALLSLLKAHNFAEILAHAPYTLNACSIEERTQAFAWLIMEDDLRRMEQLPGNFYNFHPGSHVGLGVEQGIKQIAKLLNHLLTTTQTTTILLETMAGKGSEVGSSFTELREIIKQVELADKLGICLDTCHVYDAGYDIVQDLDGVLAEFDQIIGLNKLRAIHLNDSKNSFASHKDRHEKIGEGRIGLAAISRIINHPQLRHLPFYLETPNEISGYAAEIKLLRANYQEK